MCIIAYDSRRENNERIPREILQRCREKYPHGLGAMWPETEKHKVRIWRSLDDFEGLWNLYTSIRDRQLPIALHFRYTTKGKDTLENCHPFYVNTGERNNEDFAFMHNGTLYPLSKHLPDGVSDTRYFRDEILAQMPQGFLNNKAILEMLDDFVRSDRLFFMDWQGRTYTFNSKTGFWWPAGKDEGTGVWFSHDRDKDFILRGKRRKSHTRNHSSSCVCKDCTDERRERRRRACGRPHGTKCPSHGKAGQYPCHLEKGHGGDHLHLNDRGRFFIWKNHNSIDTPYAPHKICGEVSPQSGVPCQRAIAHTGHHVGHQEGDYSNVISWARWSGDKAKEDTQSDPEDQRDVEDPTDASWYRGKAKGRKGDTDCNLIFSYGYLRDDIIGDNFPGHLPDGLNYRGIGFMPNASLHVVENPHGTHAGVIDSPDSDDKVHGCLIVIDEVVDGEPGNVERALARLDRINGCVFGKPEESHFHRERRPVKISGMGTIHPWVYIANDDEEFNRFLGQVEEGDWKQWLDENVEYVDDGQGKLVYKADKQPAPRNGDACPACHSTNTNEFAYRGDGDKDSSIGIWCSDCEIGWSRQGEKRYEKPKEA